MGINDGNNIGAVGFGLKRPVRIILCVIAALAAHAIGFLFIGKAFICLLMLASVGGALVVTLLLTGRSRGERLLALLPGAAVYVFIFAVELGSYGCSPSAAAVGALPALYPTVSAVALWLAVRAKGGRCVSIAASASAAAVFLAIYTGLRIGVEYGGFSVDALKSELDTVLGKIGESIASLTLDRGFTNIPVWGIADIDAFISSARAVIVGAIGAYLTVMAYLTTVYVSYLAERLGFEELLPSSRRLVLRPGGDDPSSSVRVEEISLGWRIEPDSVSAMVMILSYMAVIILGGFENPLPLALAMCNIVVLLTPCFLYAGLRKLAYCFVGSKVYGEVRPRTIGKGCLTVVVLLILFIILPTSPIVLLTWSGVAAVLTENHMQSAAEIFLDDGDRKE